MPLFGVIFWQDTISLFVKTINQRATCLKFRNSCPEVFCKNVVLKNFTKFTRKQLCQSLFFNKVADLRRATLSKKKLWHRCFAMNFVKFLRTSILIEHFWWLLLEILSDLTWSHGSDSKEI